MTGFSSQKDWKASCADLELLTLVLNDAKCRTRIEHSHLKEEGLAACSLVHLAAYAMENCLTSSCMTENCLS